MRTQRKFLALIIAIIMSLSIIPTTALADDVTSGDCGDNVTWKLEGSTLIISGRGDMKDYGTGGSVPWVDYKNEITAVTIEEGVTSIGERSFMGCSALTSLTIPDTVTSIKTNALHTCTALETLVIGANVSEIVQPGIYLDDRLTVTVEDGNENYAVIDNILYELYEDGTAAVLQAVKNDEPTEITVDTITANDQTYTITELKTYALAGLGELTSVTLGDGVTKIGPSSFNGCDSLSDVTMPAVEEIGASAFSGCTALAEIELPETLKSIGNYAFQGCSFTSIQFPDSLEEIEKYAFNNCSQLQMVRFGAGLEEIGEGSFNGQSLRTVDTTRIAQEFTVGGAWVGNTSSNYVIYFSNEQDAKDKYIFNQGNVIYAASQPYTIRAVTNGGIFLDGTEFSNDTLSKPYLENYQFMGWFTKNGIESGDWGEELVNGADPTPKTVIYYAKWEPCDEHTYGEPTWNWDSDYTATATFTCTKCNSPTTVTAEVASEETKAATCTETGTITHTATVTMGDRTYTDSTTETVAAIGHTWNDGAVTTPATSITDGVKTYTCTVCGETRTETIPATGGSTSTGSHHSSSSSVTTYPVTVDSAKHGTVTTSQKNASKGTTVTITVKPDDGYEMDSLTVTDKNGDRVKVTEGKNGKFTFTMPAGTVTIEAEFVQTQETPDQRFTDVPEGYWAEDEINWAADNGYMNGNTATTFNPEDSVTRQQLWMILARLSGYQPADFAEAKAWAVDNRISDGTNPGNAVSRQQLVTILYRYAAMMGYKTTGAADLTQFPDHASVAAYAADAMSWSVAGGIVGGTAAGTLNPTGTATRAQFAVILYRFCGKVVG